jgi:alcohol dehydrogenase
VEVLACTLCGSDLHTIQGKRREPVPTVLGHEILGRIAEFGPGAARVDASGRDLAEGDRVTWSVVASCGECFYCERSLPQKCERRIKYGHEPIAPRRELTGGLAEHCLLAPGTAIFRIPDRVSDEAACPANCATATVAAAMEAAGPCEGRIALILGAGMLGLTATAWARSVGCSDVIACDLDADRLAMSRAFGATHAVAPGELAECVGERSGGRGVDFVIELTGSPTAFENADPLIRLGGTLVLVGAVYPSRPISLSMERIVRGCRTIRGVHNYAPHHLRSAVEFLDARSEFPFGSLVAGWIPLDRVSNAIGSEGARSALRVGVRPLVEPRSVGQK